MPTPLATASPIPTFKRASPERIKIGYLLRRAGFGASPAELEGYVKLGLSGTIDSLLDYDKADNGTLDARLATQNFDLTRLDHIQRWWLLRMVYTPKPLQEKMVLFWHGLLTSGISKAGQPNRMWRQNEVFRQYACGNFGVMLKAISRDPAMLYWLDSRTNRKGAPNENFARELMELFTMGVGNYTEQDVRESARAFTGWGVNNNGFFFDSVQHDTGSKTFLDTRGPLTGDDVIDIIVKHPATTTYISQRIFGLFAYPNPEPEVLEPLKRAFVSSGYSIKAVVRAVLTSDAFFSQKAFRSGLKSPAELVATTMRTLAIETDGSGLASIMTRMGQTLFDPPNVAGWPGGPVWINSASLLERANFANRVAIDRRWFAPQALLDGAGVSARKAVDFYVDLLLDGVMPAEERAVLDDYALSVLRVTERDAGLRSIVYLILSSPDYQLT